MKKRLYHVVAINMNTGRKVYLTSYPDTHEACMVIIGKQSSFAAVRKQVEEVATHHDSEGNQILNEDGSPIPVEVCRCYATSAGECTCGAYWGL